MNKVSKVSIQYSTVVTLVALFGVLCKLGLVMGLPFAAQVEPIVGFALCLAVVYTVILQIRMDVSFPLVKWSEADDFKSKFLCIASRVLVILYVVCVFLPYDKPV